MKFRDHKYTWQRPHAAVYHQWSFRGPGGGLSFHVSIMDDEPGREPSAGLEFHHLAPPYGEDEAAHHSPCWLLGAPCWHNGTSLYASESVWPRVHMCKGDHGEIFRVLEREYDAHFRKLREEAA